MLYICPASRSLTVYEFFVGNISLLFVWCVGLPSDPIIVVVIVILFFTTGKKISTEWEVVECSRIMSFGWLLVVRGVVVIRAIKDVGLASLHNKPIHPGKHL